MTTTNNNNNNDDDASMSRFECLKSKYTVQEKMIYIGGVFEEFFNDISVKEYFKEYGGYNKNELHKKFKDFRPEGFELKTCKELRSFGIRKFNQILYTKYGYFTRNNDDKDTLFLKDNFQELKANPVSFLLNKIKKTNNSNESNKIKVKKDTASVPDNVFDTKIKERGIVVGTAITYLMAQYSCSLEEAISKIQKLRNDKKYTFYKDSYWKNKYQNMEYIKLTENN